MKSKIYLLVLLIGAFAFSMPSAFAQKGKGYGTVEPYSITAQALKGPSDTEVTVKLLTAKPVTSPIPAVLKKLQLKIRNAAGDVVYIKNFQNVPVVGDQVKVNVTDPIQHNTLEVLAQVKTAATVDAEMVKTKCQVLLRPDLTIPNVAAPAEQHINVPFAAEVVVKELNAQSGATFNVTLTDGGSPVGTVTGAVVSAGGQVSVVFGALSVAAPGVHNYTAEISAVVPGDYNPANNSFAFSITFTDPQPIVNPSYYYLYYYNDKWDYNQSTVNLSNGSTIYEYHNLNQYEGLNFYTYTFNSGTSTSGQPVSVDYKFETAVTTPITGSVTGLTPYYFDGNYSYYQYYDPLTNISFYAWADNYGNVSSQVQRYQSQYVYYYNDYNGYTDSYNYQYGNGQYLDLATEIKASMVTTMGNFSWGGGTVQPLYSYTYYNYVYDDTYFDSYYNSDIHYHYDQSYYYSYNYTWGITDPNILPKSGKLENSLLIGEQSFGLDKVYQNGTNATVQFQLDQEAPYILNVTDLQGREALRIVEGKQQAGLTLKQFDVSGLSKGIYLFRLQSGNKTDTRKVLLNQ
jgi:hypothetical protein